MTLNSTQLQTTLAPLVSFLAGLAAGKGLFGLDVTSWTTLIGGAVGFGATVWGIVATRKTAQIASVAAMPEVASIKLDASAPSALVAATPSNVSK